MIKPMRFSLADAEKAFDDWGANCGPGALAAVLGLTLDEVKPHLTGFVAKRYTNPTMMWAALDSLKADWRSRTVPKPLRWPTYGLARIQWEGPWTQPGVPPAAAYRYTHWVGANARNRDNVAIFDINCIKEGGWVTEDGWTQILVPWLLQEAVPRANGKWFITHSVEIASDKLSS
jgi:hypothetical protein